MLYFHTLISSALLVNMASRISLTCVIILVKGLRKLSSVCSRSLDFLCLDVLSLKKILEQFKKALFIFS